LFDLLKKSILPRER